MELIDPQQLVQFLNKIVESGVFQKERGVETSRLHYQGRFELKGPRIGKRKLLRMFSELGETSNLTFSPERLYGIVSKKKHVSKGRGSLAHLSISPRRKSW